MSRSWICDSVFIILLIIQTAHGSSIKAPCIEDSKFYRNPNTLAHNVWSPNECAKYYLCLDNEVFEFKCSEGLLFDITRQICDFKANVENCDVTSERLPPKPLLEKGDCKDGTLACGDGTCLPSSYFCDGSVDCIDGSDEGWCDGRPDKNSATNCNPQKCHLPECWCSHDGKQIPNNLTHTEVPQMIMITFNDAVNSENFDFYNKFFNDKRKNPNGCPIRGTFYVSHQYTNYKDVQYLWNKGHEIAAHSVTHRGPEEWWSLNATIEDWFDEMVGVANIINRYGGVRIEDIKGLRAPFLRVGWNRQFLMMSEFGFVYDASIVAPFSDPPLWPYTLDYKIPHQCGSTGQMCPTRSYPGLWELPLNQLLSGEYTCSMVDDCPISLSGEEIYNMLMLNFKRHYVSNRAPIGLHFNPMWFRNPTSTYAFSKFIDDLLQLPDVYFVTGNQVIDWMKNPTSVTDLTDFEPWLCEKKFKPHEIACEFPSSCKLPSRVLKSYRYLNTCFDCPKQYPWLRNEFGAE
ncbi:Similar to CDA1: Chitin deacetylase 1 (Bombyx mori) [Cotesia congregata]|uniref:Similar to CDA1: Chitin deacetylase 1 (Bombyx mori) n=1 Tax=Cotesia congregata TaxID=51543 RepID=A0A8J2HPU6_COTCN|nr:Similar to CDA1: Chitin deacetylase 1 (Bombyx mori) [Cotesia congregata]